MTKKGIKRASADVGFMFIAYNLRRLMNIVDKKLLIKFLQELALKFFTILASAKEYILRISSAIFSINNYKNKLRTA